MNKWTFTGRKIESNRITFGFSLAWYGKQYPRQGWGICFNLLFWYVDINYRSN